VAALASPGSATSGHLQRPNIILIFSDDQSYESVEKMPFLRKRMPPQGGWYRFDRAFIQNPSCCPSRATVLTGQFSHHHGVEGTGQRPAYDDSDTIATRLDAAGYRTSFVGKYNLGKVGGTFDGYIPPGWDDFVEHPTGQNRYYDYRLYENGNPVDYGSDPEDYSTDVLRDHVLDFIDSSASSEPFFAIFAPRATHNGWVAAPRHLGHYADEPVEHVPNFNEEDVSDKPAWWQDLEPRKVTSIDNARRKQWDTALALDDAVKAIFQRTKDLGLMRNTVIVFMTDNGHAFGEHRLNGKVCAYEECARTPLLVKFGGHNEGRTFPQVVGNEDLAPTFAELAGTSPPDSTDGQSFATMLRDGITPPHWRNEILLRGYNGAEKPGLPPTFWGLRTRRQKYIETVGTGEVELYDLTVDPYELENVADDPEYAEIRARLAERLEQLRSQ
jgi:N-acetylglucosamine-6-sulfatase